MSTGTGTGAGGGPRTPGGDQPGPTAGHAVTVHGGDVHLRYETREQALAASFEAALARAEELLAGADRARTALGTVRAVQVLAGGAGLACAAAAAPAAQAAALLGAAVLVLALTCGALAYTLQALLAAPLRRRLLRDENAATETVNELRELLGSVAAEGEWSRSAYRLARRRVERFPL
ncbi:hypothetical protein ACFPZ0_22780 [Streptomonospora nanhaiensis]|uniref:SMODS and SLOG-associating 2TM effector domain-containing protein n=1 Tax=Streptomonospora nanhaiensis TaxID=1323731 RepID=A0A853BVM7_9ACTN|nr:hypothetical protein [Streptomonospora nanhaiensis]MBV2365376.1 hypothetical protein [Streptomonospora nanhaiensis]MBX9390893.1 hypothetical protein [Streptomonospora nanhaiensis]NYI99030.1 hypothetical protein [Streptomonospora nanhaiensis]